MDANETFSAIPQNAKRRVMCNFPFGILNQPSWLPLHLISGGLVIEMEFDVANTAFAESGADWIVQDVALLGTLHEIDSSLANSYANHALKGNPLSLHYVSVVSTKHILPGPNATINLVRGFTRLRQIFWTFISATGKAARDMKGPANTTYAHANGNYSWMITIGSRKFPERPTEGVSEAFLRLKQAAATFLWTRRYEHYPK